MAVVGVLTGCIEQEFADQGVTSIPIQLAADYQTTTRVTDAGFADEDRMGISLPTT